MRRINPRTMPAVLAGVALVTGTPLTINAEELFAGVAPVAAGDLAAQRGGMTIGGIPIDFAVVLRTTIRDATNHEVALETTLTPAAAPVVMPSALPSAAPVVASAVPADAPAVVAAASEPQAVDTAAVALGEATRVVRQITPSQVQTLISNAANGVSVAQSTTINATLPTLRAASQLFAAHRGVAGLGADAARAGLMR